jgi:prevent-host-death family protein
MKSTTIRELKHRTSEVLGWVAEGETVEITRRSRPIAKLSPPDRPGAPVRPDFSSRLDAIYGDQVLHVSGTELVSESRGGN